MGTALCWGSCHADFDKFYRDFVEFVDSLISLNSEVYNHKLLKAVKFYNVSRI